LVVQSSSETATRIADALDRMERLVTGLLELAKQGSVIESVDEVELWPVAGDAWASVATADDLTVTVGVFDRGFYVADTGAGIPPDERAAAFERGHSTADGTGLGLTIVQAIADAHGWSIAVTEGDAGGARFEFTGVDRPVLAR
jgi:signal transduction histidine kinase